MMVDPCQGNSAAPDEMTPLYAATTRYDENTLMENAPSPRFPEQGSKGVLRSQQCAAFIYSVFLVMIGIGIGSINKYQPSLGFREQSFMIASNSRISGVESLTYRPRDARKDNSNTLLYPKVDGFGPYLEYSVIHSDRSLNLMSPPFQTVMRDLNLLLKTTYNADRIAIIPGSGTFGMESVARQFASQKHVLVIRNGYFSYRWTQIFDFGGSQQSIPDSHSVMMAQPVPQEGKNYSTHVQYSPPPIDEVLKRICLEQPAVVFAPHVETSTGILLPDEYIGQMGQAVHDVGGLLVVDAIASGTVWLDMKELGIDVLISAPQKDWTSPPSSALIMMSQRATDRIDESPDSSFSLSLAKWLSVMDAYVAGGFAYHTTPPTDALRTFQRVSVDMLKYGLPELKKSLNNLGRQARELFDSRGLVSVAAPGYQAPGVLVYYSPDHVENAAMVQLFEQEGLQIAKGTVWMIREPPDTKTFRIGLFGLDKVVNERRTIATLKLKLDSVIEDVEQKA